MDVRYSPGPRFVVVGEFAIAVLDPDVSSEVLETIWRTLAAGGDVGEVLQVMTGAYGTNLTAIPPFAVIAPALDGVRLAVRGPLIVRVGGLAGTETVSGVGVTTWHERWVPDPFSVEILSADTPAACSPEPLATELPIGSGVVKAEGVRLVVRETTPPVDSALPAFASAPDVVLAPAFASAPDVASAPTVMSAAPGPDPQTATNTEVLAGEPEDPDVTFVEPGDPVAANEPVEPAPRQAPFLSSRAQTLAPGVQTVELTAADGSEDSYDHLWGPTVLRRVEDAAVREAEVPEDAPAGPFDTGALIADVPGFGAAGAAPVESTEGDHDGETIMGNQLAAIRAQARAGAPATSSPGAPTPTGATVLARVCDSGHPSPPQSTSCRVCGLDLLGDASRVGRPTLGRMVLSNGSVIDLDRPVVVGRKPRVSRVQGADLPRLITVSSPQHDISRSHLEVRIEEWHVLVVDLATTNGTILQRPGQPYQRLDPNETTMMRSEDVLDIGDGVTITFEAIP
ncbi:MAG: FHA domain-containing protein [Actinomycetota bacterium]